MPTLTLAGEVVDPLPSRALHWPARRTVLIADAHLGKAVAFDRGGLPLGRRVAEATTRHDLARLSLVLSTTGAQRLVILGDLLHARASHEPQTIELFAEWRRAHAALAIDLIRGNHDVAAGDPPAQWHIACHEPGLRDGPFTYHHEPTECRGSHVLAGHIHPAVRIGVGRSGGETAACFVVGSHRTILPAFGSFTGSARMPAGSGDRLFAVGPENVIELTPKLRAGAEAPQTA